jgi:hypothetical protein
VTTAVPGGTLTYTITASHVTGLQALVNAMVADAFSPMLTCAWICTGSGGGSCTAGPVSGPIADPVTLPVGSSVTYTADCAISSTATGSIVTTATVTGLPGLFDPEPSNPRHGCGRPGSWIDDAWPEGSGSTGLATVTLAPGCRPRFRWTSTQDGRRRLRQRLFLFRHGARTGDGKE